MKYAAILGCGNVGRGAAALLTENAEEIFRRTGAELFLRYILVRRDDPDNPWRDKFITDFSVIENDPEISVVAECIGGVGAALDYCRRTLAAGKHLVTSNKELVARYGLELSALAEEKGVSFLFEGAVAGGIPVLRPIRLCLAGNRLREACGVINGTANYILTSMERFRVSFADALQEAQNLGYAERDPSADVLGWDSGRKTAILADLCFGKFVDIDRVKMEGITTVETVDMAAAECFGCRIKLLGRAVLTDSGAAVYTAPHLIPRDNPLGTLDGVKNGVILQGDGMGEICLSGPGAGSFPTGSAVVGDIVDAALSDGRPRIPRWTAAEADYLLDTAALESYWYLRCRNTREEVLAAFPEAEFAPVEATAFRLPRMTEAVLDARAAALDPVHRFRLLL